MYVYHILLERKKLILCCVQMRFLQPSSFFLKLLIATCNSMQNAIGGKKCNVDSMSHTTG